MRYFGIVAPRDVRVRDQSLTSAAVLVRQSQVLGNPVDSRAGGAVELVRVGEKMTAGKELEPLRLAGAVVGLQREIRRGDRVVVADDHQQRRRRDPRDERSGLI